jgi:uncharacterized membrane protein required for colicin V production
MGINLVDVAIVAIMLFSLFAGMYKGFIASALAALGFAAAWFGAMYLFPFLAGALSSNEELMGFLGYYLDAGALFSVGGTANTLVTGALQDGNLTQLLSNMALPEILKNAFQANVVNQQFASVGLTTLSEYLNETILVSLINVLSFLVMFALSYGAALLLINLLNAVFHFPPLKHFDSLLGGVFGFVRGAIIVMLVFASIPIFEAVMQINFIDKLISEASLARYFTREVAIPDVIARAFKAL